MLTYNYTAKDPKTGDTVKAELQADNEQSAAKLIQEQGLLPLDIKLGQGVGKESRLKRIKAKDKVLFSRQLSTLINAGLPLLQSLRQVNKQTVNKPLRGVVNQVITDVEAGSTLANAFGKHPTVFNNVYLSLVAAGETSGTLDSALERLANQQEKDADVVAKIRGAMIYPAIVLLVMLGVLGFMLIKVLPQVKTLYESLPGAELPLITRVLLALSSAVTQFWWIFLIVVVVALVFTGRWARGVTSTLR